MPALVPWAEKLGVPCPISILRNTGKNRTLLTRRRPDMNDTLTLNTVVSYWDVDQDEVLLLPGVFKFLQEAAIKHADLF